MYPAPQVFEWMRVWMPHAVGHVDRELCMIASALISDVWGQWDMEFGTLCFTASVRSLTFAVLGSVLALNLKERQALPVRSNGVVVCFGGESAAAAT